MKNWEKLIIFWGVLDILSLLIYGITNIVKGKVPIINDLQMIIDNSNSFGLAAIKLLIPVAIILYVSLAFSGYYLIKRKKIGAIISYCQTPFRLVTIIPPSIFVLFWLMGFIKLEMRQMIILTISVLLITEVFKVFSLYKWQKIIKTTSNKSLNLTG